MKQHEIRVQGGEAPRVHSCLQLSDHAAVRRARAIVREDEAVEVWRGETCVYLQPAKETAPELSQAPVLS